MLTTLLLDSTRPRDAVQYLMSAYQDCYIALRLAVARGPDIESGDTFRDCNTSLLAIPNQ